MAQTTSDWLRKIADFMYEIDGIENKDLKDLIERTLEKLRSFSGAKQVYFIDENVSNILLNYRLKSYKAALGYRHLFNKRNVISLNGTWINQEYRQNTYGNQINVGIAYQRRF